MHKALRTFLALGSFLAGAALLRAQPALKVVVVDMARVYDTHYEAISANAKMKAAAQRYQEEFEGLVKQHQEATKEYNQLMEESRSPLKNQQAREKAEAEAAKKREQIERIQGEAQAYQMTTQESLQKRARNYRNIIMDGIRKVVNEVARTHGATLVLDTAGLSVFGVPVVLYADPAYDITDQIIREVNKDQPPAAAEGTAATGGTTPPTFTVPNVTPEPKKN